MPLGLLRMTKWAAHGGQKSKNKTNSEKIDLPESSSSQRLLPTTPLSPTENGIGIVIDQPTNHHSSMCTSFNLMFLNIFSYFWNEVL